MSPWPRSPTASDRHLHTRPQPDTVLLLSPVDWNCNLLLGNVVAQCQLTLKNKATLGQPCGPCHPSYFCRNLSPRWELSCSLVFHEGGSSQSLGSPLELRS